MKRTNVIVDEKLLERARRMGGEKTYSATINQALEEYVRKRNFWAAYQEFQELAHSEGVFDPEYVKEKTGNPLKAARSPKKRVSAYEVRLPKVQASARGPR